MIEYGEDRQRIMTIQTLNYATQTQKEHTIGLTDIFISPLEGLVHISAHEQIYGCSTHYMSLSCPDEMEKNANCRYTLF